MNLEVKKGDITKISVDAIVNAANTSLMGGGGVDGAIHRAGGPAIIDECKRIVSQQGGCKTGEAVITGAGNLPARYVIHTVGPVWYGGNTGEAANLASCYRNSLTLASENKCKSVAFPNISTGVYHFPKKLAAEIAVHSVIKYGKDHPFPEQVVFICFDDENFGFISDEIKRQIAN
jgi:O-acetyl-ADP-ribose deacetylase (regulator of RNase III)